MTTSEQSARPSPRKVAARALVVDEDLDEKIAKGLRFRGYRDARTNRQERLTGKGDQLLIPALARLSPPVILVTGDIDMPWSHNGILQQLALPLAIVDDMENRGALKQFEYQHDTVHRWAHMISRIPPRRVVFCTPDRYQGYNIDGLPDKNRRLQRQRRRRARQGS